MLLRRINLTIKAATLCATGVSITISGTRHLEQPQLSCVPGDGWRESLGKYNFEPYDVDKGRSRVDIGAVFLFALLLYLQRTPLTVSDCQKDICIKQSQSISIPFSVDQHNKPEDCPGSLSDCNTSLRLRAEELPSLLVLTDGALSLIACLLARALCQRSLASHPRAGKAYTP